MSKSLFFMSRIQYLFHFLEKFDHLYNSLLTTKFGNLSIEDEDQIEAESKTKIVSATE